MLNNLEAYQEAGRECAVARNQNDEARAQHWKQHYRKMWELESGDDRVRAHAAFNDAYTAARRI